MQKLLIAFCLVGVFSMYTSSAIEAADYPRYDGKVSPIDLPIEIRYRPIVASPQEGEIFYLVDMGRQKTTLILKSAALIETQKKNNHLLLSFKIDPDKTSLTINGQDKSNMLKARRGLKRYFEITDAGELLKSNNNNFAANSMALIAPKLSHLSVEKPDQLVSEGSWSMETSTKIPTSILFKVFAIGTSEFKDRKILVGKVVGEMVIGDHFRFPLQGYQLIDITTGYILEMKIAGDTKLKIKDQAVTLRLKLSSIFDLPVSSIGSLQRTTNVPVKQNQQANQGNPLTLEKAKSECSQLGFEKSTEKYGECVLQLLK